MKKIVSLIVILLLIFRCDISAQQTFTKGNEKVPNHPRILLLKGEEKKIKKNIKKDKFWKEYHETLIYLADSLCQRPVYKYEKQGQRMLIAYANFRHMFLWGYAYRMTGDKKYAKRLETELLAACAFPDWNPKHYLDVAELTAGVAIGYDWLYSYLTPDKRKIIETAIVEKGLKPSFQKQYNFHWLDATHNWNQVCHAALSYGALAVWDVQNDIACEIVNRALNKIRIPMKKYAPDGGYAEGIGYWEFGTMWNVMFLGLLDKTFKTDFGLSDIPGFMKTNDYIMHTLSPSMHQFCYSDGGPLIPCVSPTVFWFYHKTKDPSILYNQYRLYKLKGFNHWDYRDGAISRIAPAAIIWSSDCSFENPIIPTKLFWKAGGENPLACMRSEWVDNKGSWLSVKLGSPSVSHGHMDVGSFNYESDGVEWAIDLGGEGYYNLERVNVDLWSAQRWEIFRHKNIAHCTLAFNDKLQVPSGKADFTSYSEDPNHMYVVGDLTPVYKGQVNKAERAFSLVDKKYAVIEDKIACPHQFRKVTWTLVTKTKVTQIGDKRVMLEKDGKKLYINVDSKCDIIWKTRPAKGNYTFDTPNVGATLVTFDMDLERGKDNFIRVYLTPTEEIPASYKPVLK